MAFSRGSKEYEQFASFDLTPTSGEQNLLGDPTLSTTAEFSDNIIENSFPAGDTAVENLPSSDPTVKNTSSNDIIVENSYLTNDTAVDVSAPSDRTVKNAPSTDTTVEYPFPTNDYAIENSAPTDLTVKNALIDTILKNSPPTKDIPPTLNNVVEKSTSETPDFADNSEWGNIAADLELMNNYPCRGQVCLINNV